MTALWNIRKIGGRRLLRRIWDEIWTDNVLGRSAELSFYFLLGIFPLLLFLTAVLGLLLQSQIVLDQALKQYLSRIAPESASGLIESTLQEITQASGGGKMSFGLLFGLWTASSGMAALIDALNVAYDVREGRAWWKRWLTALVLTVGFLGAIAMALIILLSGDRIVGWLGPRIGLAEGLLHFWAGFRWFVLLLLVLGTFNCLYIYAPNVEHREWHWLMPGTVVGVVLWLAVSFGFKLYLDYFNQYSATYGSIGTVIILLVWFYLTGAAILIGAEVNSELENAVGKTAAVKEEEKPEPAQGSAS